MCSHDTTTKHLTTELPYTFSFKCWKNWMHNWKQMSQGQLIQSPAVWSLNQIFLLWRLCTVYCNRWDTVLLITPINNISSLWGNCLEWQVIQFALTQICTLVCGQLSKYIVLTKSTTNIQGQFITRSHLRLLSKITCLPWQLFETSLKPPLFQSLGSS